MGLDRGIRFYKGVSPALTDFPQLHIPICGQKNAEEFNISPIVGHINYISLCRSDNYTRFTFELSGTLGLYMSNRQGYRSGDTI